MEASEQNITNEGEEREQVESPDSPDPEAGPAVDPIETDPGEGVREGESVPAENTQQGAGFDPNAPVATSPPPPEAQSGVPQPTDGSNEGVEPGTPGPVDPEQPRGPEGEGGDED